MIIMPVHNEQACLRKVVSEWFRTFRQYTEHFVFWIIDDGSKDNCPAILRALQAEFGPRIEVHFQENQGHGQSCLKGYKLALQRQIPYVFQIDSDGQCDPQYFRQFWLGRENFEAIYGKRVCREDGWRRSVVSRVLQATLLLACGVWCDDANVPYRLYHTESLRGLPDRIPSTFHLVNVAITVLVQRKPRIRQKFIAIGFRAREGGEPSVKMSKFGSRAFELVAQLRQLK